MLPENLIRRLWERMTEIYGHRWTSAYGEDAGKGAGVTWAKGLAGLSVEQIATGVDAAVSSTEGWPPTLPEFRAMCFNIPSLAYVRSELSDKHARRTPFVRLVFSKMDGYRFARADVEAADRMLREAYLLARDHVLSGGALPPEPAGELEHQEPQRQPASPHVVERNLEAISRLLGDRQIEVDEAVGELDQEDAA